MNGVALHFSLTINKTETSYDKLKHCFSLAEDSNQEVVNELTRIEREILALVSTTLFEGKQPMFHIENQTKQGFVKLFNGSSRSHKTYSATPPMITTHHTLKTYHMKPRVPLNFSQTQDFILKISGIWYNDVNYGITYKFEKAGKIVGF
jgi:hypothetical protein